MFGFLLALGKFAFELSFIILAWVSWFGGLLRGINVFGLSYLEWIGVGLSLAAIAYGTPLFLNTMYCVYIAPMLGLYTDLRKMGQWAVITGASDGIGKAYAEGIAKLGINIVLISRSENKLKDVADDIEKTFGVKTKIIVADFTEGVHIYDQIEKELQGLEIGTLVNNVGMWYPYIDFFADLPNGRKVCQDMISCNVLPVTLLTHMILPKMVARKRGVVINVSSITGETAFPFMTLYAATKAFTTVFSESLNLEYEKEGIIIQAVIPAYVSTKLSRIATPSWFCPTATDFVQMALKTVGVESKTAVHIPHRLWMFSTRVYASIYPEIYHRFVLAVGVALRNKSKLKREKKNRQNQYDLKYEKK